MEGGFEEVKLYLASLSASFCLVTGWQTLDLYPSLSPSVGIEQGTLLSCVNDIAAATQHTVATHLAKRTHRAILFCKANGLLPSSSPTLVSET